MPNPFSVFAPAGPLKVTINGGPAFTVNGGSHAPDFLPGSLVPPGPSYAPGLPAPNVLGSGANTLVVIGPSIDKYPETFTVYGPSQMYVEDGDSVQLYLILHDNQVLLSWMVLVNGVFYSYGHSWDDLYESSATSVG